MAGMFDITWRMPVTDEDIVGGKFGFLVTFELYNAGNVAIFYIFGPFLYYLSLAVE